MNKKTSSTEWLEKSTALIRFSKEEMQNLLVALVIAIDASHNLSQMEYAENFKKLRKDIAKIKNDLERKERKYEEKNFQTR
tara:strand:- start:3479 stop:3721 length:243 start_codon:yes stop_codon:yes gene_type:complete